MRNPSAQGACDSNQSAIAGWYEELMCLVYDSHKWGGGFGDLVIRCPTRQGGILQIVEVKTAEGKLGPSQETFLRQWGTGCVAVVRTREDVHAHVQRIQRKHSF